MVLNILILSDDYFDLANEHCKNVEYNLKELFDLEAKVTINTKLIIPRKKHNIILIDYGLVGDKIDVIEKLYFKSDLVWTGALPWCMIKEDLQKLYPDKKHLAELPFCDLGATDASYTIWRIVEDN